jgi:hypothetical protein
LTRPFDQFGFGEVAMTPVRTTINALLTLAALCWTLSAVPLLAQDSIWNVQGELIGDKGKATEDMSGIACTTDTGFPRTCLVIDDELQAAQVVTLTEGNIAAGRLIKLTDDQLNGKPVELDGEGVAYADGFFYVIGSHGRPRNSGAAVSAEEMAGVAARITASSKLARLRFDAASGEIAPQPEDVKISTSLRTLIDAEPAFALFKDKPLENGGITIEGIAIYKDRLLAGFRGPSVDGKGAVILSAALGHFFDGQAADAKVHFVPLGPGRGVRDLAPYDNGILILAGPVGDVEGTYSVFWWDGASAEAKLLRDLPAYRSKKDKQWKPEGLLPLDRNAEGVRVLLLLDGPKDGAPRTERLPYP